MSTTRGRWLGTAWLLGLCLATLGPGLGTSASLTYHEAFVALGGREILASGSWGQPTIGGRPWLEKPPLPFQAAAAVGAVAGGVSPWAARLPSALAATGLVLGVALLARHRCGAAVALLAGAVQATTFWSFYRGRLAEADILLACLIVWTLAAFDRLRDEDDAPVWRWAFFVLLGLTSWVKGIGFGAALAGSVVVAALIWDRRPEPWRRLFFPLGWAVAALLTLAWPLAMLFKHGGGVGALWLSHITDRVGPRVGHGNFAGEEPLGYLIEVLGQGLPWTPLAMAGAWRALGALRPGHSGNADRLLWAWTIAPLLLVSIPGGRNAHYAIHAMPAWSIWAALALTRSGERLERRGWTTLRVRRLAIAALSILAIAYGLGFALLVPRFDDRGEEWAFYREVARLVPAAEPLILLHDDWDRQPYPTPFGPVPHDLAVRLYYLDRPAAFHYEGEPTATGPPTSSVAVIGRERDVPLLAEVGDPEILARGPTTRWDRSFVLFRVRPVGSSRVGDRGPNAVARGLAAVVEPAEDLEFPLQFVGRGIALAEGAGHLAARFGGEPLAGPMDPLARPLGRRVAPQPLNRVGVVGAEPQDGAQRSAVAGFALLQGPPRLLDQLLAPDSQEGFVLGRVRRGLLRPGRVDRRRRHALLGLFANDQVAKRDLQIVSEAATLGVGPVEVAPEELQGELLKQVVGAVAVAGRAACPRGWAFSTESRR